MTTDKEHLATRVVLRLQPWLAHRRLPVVLPIIAVSLTLPSLWAGWVADDHLHRLRLASHSELPEPLAELGSSPMKLFEFADGDPANTHRWMDIGLWPWWTLPELRAAFMRPVTVLTHWLDYELWPETPALMHAHSLVWFAALITVTTLLYRRLFGLTWVAGLAALLYAIDDARAVPAAWLANRNALITTFFGVCAIIAHDRWRRCGWQAGAFAGPVLFIASLLAKEAGIATCAYLFAHAVFLDRGTARARIVALLPYTLIVLIWRVTWTHLGYGVSGVEIYVDPANEPLQYAAAVLRHAPVLLLGQFFLPPSELYLLCIDMGVSLFYWVPSALAVAVLAVVMLRRLAWDGTTRFWVLGTVLALLPACATFPADRGLSFVGLGAFALVAKFLCAVFGRAADTLRHPTGQRAEPAGEGRCASRRLRTLTRALGIGFVATHIVLAPLILAVRSAMPIGPVSFIERLQINIPMDVSVERQSVIVVTAPLPILAGYLAERRALDGVPVPAHTRVLAPSDSDFVTVSRPGIQTLVVRPANGYLALAADRLARSSGHPMSLGDKVILTGMTAEVIALTPDSRPAEVAFHFTVPLEDPSLRWFAWGGPSFASFTPPPVGETITLSTSGRGL